jgi:hypothetical protein
MQMQSLCCFGKLVFEIQVIPVVSVAETNIGRRPTFLGIRRESSTVSVLFTASILPIVIPHDPIDTCATGNVIRTVSSIAQVQNGSANLVMIKMGKLSVIWRPKHATKDQSGTRKVLVAETNIECD